MIYLKVTTDSPELYRRLVSHPDARQPHTTETPFGTKHTVVFFASESLQAALALSDDAVAYIAQTDQSNECPWGSDNDLDM